jgi:hypothetical protein
MPEAGNIFEIRDGLWNLVGGDRWEAYEETAKFVEGQPKIKNGRGRMLRNRMTMTGLTRYVSHDPKGAEKFLKKMRKKPLTYFKNLK